jgi:hypothetical protein
LQFAIYLQNLSQVCCAVLISVSVRDNVALLAKAGETCLLCRVRPGNEHQITAAQKGRDVDQNVREANLYSDFGTQIGFSLFLFSDGTAKPIRESIEGHK